MTRLSHITLASHPAFSLSHACGNALSFDRTYLYKWQNVLCDQLVLTTPSPLVPIIFLGHLHFVIQPFIYVRWVWDANITVEGTQSHVTQLRRDTRSQVTSLFSWHLTCNNTTEKGHKVSCNQSVFMSHPIECAQTFWITFCPLFL